MLPFVHEFHVNLRTGAAYERAKKPLSQGNALADKIVVHVQDCGKDVDLSGMGVSALVVRYDGQTVPLTGTVEGGAACITLDKDSYAVPGEARVTVMLSAGEMVQTVLVLLLTIDTSQTSIVVDNGVIGDLSELLGAIAEMRTATADALEAAAKANAAVDNVKAMLTDAAPGIIADASGAVATITDGAERPAQNIVSTIEAVQSGEGDTISGWNAVTLTCTGKNILPYSDYSGERKGVTFTSNNDGTYVLNGTATADAFYRSSVNAFHLGVLPAGDYTVSVVPASAVWYVRARIVRSDTKAVIATTGRADGVITFTADGVTDYSAGFFVSSGGAMDNVTVSLQIERGGSATEHEMYQGQAFTTDLPETVYGGTLDWTSGILTVTHGADGAALTEPITHQLMPQRIALLKGSNNLWSDSGETSVTYIADTRMYIDNAIAAIAASIIDA